MRPDTTMNEGLDLSETGVELAELIFDVARECDGVHSLCYSIDVGSLRDELLMQVQILRVQVNNPHLSEAEMQSLVDAIITENDRKKEELAAAKAAKRVKVKQRIHGSAAEGYELAYSICRNIDSDAAKELPV